MAHMLSMAAFEVRHPMVLIVQMVADNAAYHRTFAF